MAHCTSFETDNFLTMLSYADACEPTAGRCDASTEASAEDPDDAPEWEPDPELPWEDSYDSDDDLLH